MKCDCGHSRLVEHIASRIVLEYFYQDSISAHFSDEKRKSLLTNLIVNTLSDLDILKGLIVDCE